LQAGAVRAQNLMFLELIMFMNRRNLTTIDDGDEEKCQHGWFVRAHLFFPVQRTALLL
jgi:hypothetical protein